ncbi:phosphoadenylyl-sulfate reductase [Arcticibacterium luteifluviistationis]|uniref:Adenosine 5'-phosphosulfate reductase n=1 Tax=Arcticibacterium luteifluviistationis TaxID=1784714 RepID=A0A2Z4GC09_9BACT|nr:phosphoadenylyl-sulfate reductase [Arcticibacterium luteifluviistationis]AWV98598.1 phosphoadenylyl-sulfate reductase [Arcticibacterium luteifluviistationis]
MEDLFNKTLEERLNWVVENHSNIVFSSSFGQEDQAITHAIFSKDLPVEVFTLDTGRHFQETYEVMDKTKARYKKEFTTYFPETAQVESLVKAKGFNSFFNSVEDRKECCFIRKIAPLKRALKDADVWITGLRADQSENRNDMKMWEWDEGNQVHKFNPLIDWSFEQMEDYLKENKVPQNSLHKKGFVSIGCGPCTRAIVEGEHPRAGRWYWEESQKECGLHAVK